MKNLMVALSAGIIFGLGLAVSQMINPDKVLGFLDIVGNWDPSLALVMAGALTVAMIGFRWARTHEKPLFEERFHITDKTALDKPLVIGAAIFGVGWGMTGYCPGPAVASLALGNREALLMVVSVYVGFWVAGLLARKD